MVDPDREARSPVSHVDAIEARLADQLSLELDRPAQRRRARRKPPFRVRLGEGAVGAIGLTTVEPHELGVATDRDPGGLVGVLKRS